MDSNSRLIRRLLAASRLLHCHLRTCRRSLHFRDGTADDLAGYLALRERNVVTLPSVQAALLGVAGGLGGDDGQLVGLKVVESRRVYTSGLTAGCEALVMNDYCLVWLGA